MHSLIYEKEVDKLSKEKKELYFGNIKLFYKHKRNHQWFHVQIKEYESCGKLSEIIRKILKNRLQLDRMCALIVINN